MPCLRPRFADPGGARSLQPLRVGESRLLLKAVMQTELDDTRLVALNQAVDAAECRYATSLIREVEIGPVHEVQHLAAQLKPVAFGKRKLFERR